MADAEVVAIPESVYRIGRSSDLVHFSRISPEDAALPSAGNRFDVPGGGVLYAATSEIACFGETLARYRPTPRMRELLKGEEGFMLSGGVPRDWRLQRSIATLATPDPLPFLDVEHVKTLAFLSDRLSADLVAMGYENLDVSDIRNGDRKLSRAVALYAYTASDAEDNFLYSGIRYTSRLDSDWECWAIFDGTSVDLVSRRSIDVLDPDLVAVSDLWGLRPY